MDVAHLLKWLLQGLGIVVPAVLGHVLWASLAVLFVLLRPVARELWQALGADLVVDLAWPHVEALRRRWGLPTIEGSRRRSPRRDRRLMRSQFGQALSGA